MVHQVGTCNSSSYSRGLGDSIIALHSGDNREPNVLEFFSGFNQSCLDATHFPPITAAATLRAWQRHHGN